MQYRQLGRAGVRVSIIALGSWLTYGNAVAEGMLTGKYKPGQQPEPGTRATDPRANAFIQHLLNEETLTAVQNLQTVAQQGGYSLSQMAMAWVLRKQIVSSAIIGATRPEQGEENAKASEIILTEEVLQQIDEILGDVVQSTR